MQIDVYSATGSKLKQLDLPATLFGEEVNWGLIHQAVVRQQSNRRQSPAHVKTRGEVRGSTKKLYAQKHTGQARRGAVRSPLLRGGGKTFGPRNDKNYIKDMPRKMRHAALRACLSLQASKGNVFGIDSYPETIKTKAVADMLKKMPLQHGRKVLLITDGTHNSLSMSARNIEGVKTVSASYLNPEDVLNARHLIFLVDALDRANKLFGKNDRAAKTSKASKPVEEKAPKAAKKMTKKPVSKKKTAANLKKKTASESKKKESSKPEESKEKESTESKKKASSKKSS